MFRLSLKNLWAYKSRLILSMLSIVLGVAFLSGTLVFSATIQRSFDDLFASVYKQTDAFVRSTDTEPSSDGFSIIPKAIPRSVVETVQNAEGVSVAEGSISSDSLVVIGSDGKREFSSNGPPTFGNNIPNDPRLNPWVLVGKNGEATSSQETVDVVLADDELLVDKLTADVKKYKIGDKLKVVLSDSVREYKIKGFVRFGTADGLGGPAAFLFNDQQITDIAGRGDTYSDITVIAKSGFSQDEVKDSIESELSSKYDSQFEVLTGKEITEETQSDFRTAISFFTIGLLGFAFISFFIALIIIVNSFAIIMAQRKQEYALLRAVGAKPSQIRRSVFVEALIIGLISSAAGIVTGIGLAMGIRKVMDSTGLRFPAGGLVIQSNAVLVGMLVGTLATIGSAFFPAWIASRIAPIEALRDSAFEKNRTWIWRIIFISISSLITILLFVLAYSADTKVGPMSMAMGMLFFSVIISIPLLVRPFTFIVGSKVAGVLLIIFGGRRAFGVTGDIARRNNVRNPRRSGRTALALMIGVSLVVFITVFVSSISATFDDYLKTNFRADLIVGSFGGPTQLTTSRCEAIAADETVKASSCIAFSEATVSLDSGNSYDLTGDTQTIAVIDSTATSTLFSTTYKGMVNNLGSDNAILSKDYAEKNDLKIGSKIGLLSDNGDSVFKVTGILDEGIFDSNVTIDKKGFTTFDNLVPSQFAFVVLNDGASAEKANASIEQIFKDTGIEVTDQKTLREQQPGPINTVLRVFYGLLALAIIIAAIGIVNTMSLSILERRRELGLMRAIGTSKSQVRGFIRFESVIISVMGTAIGVLTGIACSYFFIQALKEEGFNKFAVDPGSIVNIFLLSALIGVLAGAWPAYRATKVDVLKAITVE